VFGHVASDPTVSRLIRTLQGSRTGHTLLTSGDQRSPAVGHDRRRVAATVIPDLPAGSEAGLAAGTNDVTKDVELLALIIH